MFRSSIISLFFILSAIWSIPLKAQTNGSGSGTISDPFIVNSFPFTFNGVSTSNGQTAIGMQGLCFTLPCCSVQVFKVTTPSNGVLRAEMNNFTPLGGSMIAYSPTVQNPSAFSEIKYIASSPGNFCGFRDTLQLGRGYKDWDFFPYGQTPNVDPRYTEVYDFNNPTYSRGFFPPGDYYILVFNENQQTQQGVGSVVDISFEFAEACAPLSVPTTLDFDTSIVNSEKDTASFYVHNNRQLDVIIDTSLLNINGIDAANFNILTYPDTNLAVGDSALIEILFEPIKGGNLTADLDIVFSDTTCTATSTVTLNGNGVLPIQISGNGQNIADGSTTTSIDNNTDFGEIVLNSTSTSRTFTIKNIGHDTLRLNGNPIVDLPNSLGFLELFFLTSNPSNKIAPGGSTTFEIEFRPNSNSKINQLVSIPFGDSSTFTFRVSGLVNGRNALDFDGSNDYVIIDSIADQMAGLTAFTFEIGMEIPPSQSGNDMILAANTSSNGSRMFFKIDDGKLEFDVGSSSEQISNLDIRDGQWHKYTFVFDNGTLDYYLDGVYQSTVSNNVPAFAATDRWSLGQEYDNGGPSDFLLGEIDEVRIWNSARSQQEILDNQSCEILNPDSGLIAYYTCNQTAFNNTNITDLKDNSIFENHGLLRNFALTLNGNSTFTQNPSFININCSSFSPEVCDMPSFTSPSGQVLTTSGQYFDTIPNAMGGDSNMVVDLRLNYTNVEVDQVNDADLCTGDTYEVSRPRTSLTSTLNFEKDNDDWVALDGLEDSLVNTNRSVFLWMRAAGQVNGDNQVLVAMNSSGTATVCNFGIRTNEELWMYDGGNNRNSGVVVTDGKWHFVGYTYDEASNETKMYVDGVEVRTYSNGQSLSSTSRISLGQEFDGSSTSDFFDGEMTEVSIWKEVLDINDIKAIMTAPISNSHAKYSQLVAYYTANATCGESALQLNDFSGNNLHGTASSTSIINIDSLVALEGFDASSHFNFSLTNNGSVVTPNNGQDYSITTAGNYQLAFERDYFSITDDFKVTLNPFPSITTQPVDAAIPLGSSTSFTVLASGTSNYQWYRIQDSIENKTLQGNVVRSILVEADTVYVGTNSGLNISTDGGQTFVGKSTAAGLGGANIYAIVRAGGLLYVAEQTKLCVSSDNGNSFTCNEVNPTKLDIIRTIATDGLNVYIATDQGLVVTNDGGLSFTYPNSPTDFSGNIQGVSYDEHTGTLYVSTSNKLYKSTDKGATFSLLVDNVAIGASFTRVWSFDGNIFLYASVTGGTALYASTDNGSTFSEIKNGTSRISPQNVFHSNGSTFIGTGQGLLISSSNLNSFEKLTTNNGLPSNAVFSVHVNNNELYVGTNSGLAIRRRPLLLQGETTSTLNIDTFKIGMDSSRYYVELTTPGSPCSVISDTVLLTQFTGLFVQINQDSAVSCNGFTNAGATVSASNGAAPYTYLWSNSETTTSITGLGAGNYSVTVTDNNGLTATENITISEPMTLSTEIVSNAFVDCNGAVKGGATASVNGGTTPYNYLWSNNATTDSIYISTTGTFTVTVTDNNNCTATNSFNLAPLQQAVVSILQGNTASVVLGDSIQLTTNSQNGVSYEWFKGLDSDWRLLGSEGFSSGGARNTRAQVGTDGTIYVAFRDEDNGDAATVMSYNEGSWNLVGNAAFSAGAIGALDFKIAEDNTLYVAFEDQANASKSTVMYFNGSVWQTLGSTGFSAGGVLSVSLEITSNDTVFVGYRDLANSSRATVQKFNGTSWETVGTAGFTSGTTIAGDLGISANGTLYYAFGELSSGSALSVMSFDGSSWQYVGPQGFSNPSAARTNTLAFGLDGTLFVGTITGTGVPFLMSVYRFDGTNWLLQDTSLLHNSNPVHNAVAIAPNGSIYTQAISGTNSSNRLGSIYQLNGGVWEAVGNEKFTSSQPYESSLAFGLDGNPIFIHRDPRNLNGSNNRATAWRFGPEFIGSGLNVHVSDTGFYVLVGATVDGCVSRDTIFVNKSVVTGPILNITIDSNATCNGFSDGGLTATVSNGVAPYTFEWSNNETTASVTGLVAGTYSVTVTDNNGDTATDLAIVGEPSVLSAIMQVDSNVSCNSYSNGGVTATANGGTTPYTYLWSNTATTASITGVAAGTYSVTITDAKGCTASNNTTIMEPTLLIAAIALDSNDNGNGGGATASATGGTSPYSYFWSNAATTASITGVAAGNYTVTVTDDKGCTDTESITITAGPSIAIQLDSNVSCNGLSDAGATVNVNGGAMPYTYLWSNNSNTASITGVAAGTYIVTVTDNNSISAVDSITIIVEDNVLPTIITQNASVYLDANGLASITTADIDNGSNDNCGSVTLSLDSTNFDCSEVGANTVTLYVTDANNNVDSATATVTVLDTLLPTVITQNATVYLDANGLASITTADIDNGSSDNCGLGLGFLSKSSFGCNNIGNNTIQLRISDVNGNIDSASAIVTVMDTLLPTVITQNATVYLDANGLGSITTADIDNGSKDNCGSVTLSLDSTNFDCSEVGANNVTLYVMDANNNLDSAVAIVTVVDSLLPTVITQNASVYLDANGLASITTADIDNGSNDNCGNVTLSLDSNNFDCSEVGANTVTLYVTDANNNVDSATAIVTVMDTLLPTVITQNASVYLDANGLASITTADIDNGSNDNCGNVTLSLDSTNFDCSEVGANTVTLYVKDSNNNNVDSATAIVTVMDTLLPTVITQNTTVYLNANGLASITTADIDNSSNDNCGSVTLSLDSTDFDCSEVGVNTVTLYATDSNNNLDSATATVTVLDTLLPTVITQNATVYLDANGLASITTADIDNGSNDNCGSVILSLDSTNFDCSEVGVNTVTLYVTDANNNLDSATAVVTVIDTLLPTVITQNATVYLDANGLANITTADIDNGSNDNCGSVTLSLDSANFDCSEVGANTVTLYVTDANNNLDSATATVTVMDTLLPTVITQNASVYLDANGLASVTTTDIDNGSNDNCGNVTLSLDSTNFDCSEVGANTVTLYVTDANNNLDSATATVTVMDTLLPNVITQNTTVYLNSNGLASITTADIDNGSNDNCGNVTLSLDSANFDCSEVGVNTVTLYATDSNNNLDSATATVTVMDTLLPTVITQNATIYLDANGLASITTANIDNGSNDNCGNVTLSLDSTNFDCSEVGVNTVTLYVTDANNNIDSSTATVTVMDTLLPTVITQNASVYLDANGLASITTANIDNGSNDNCGNVTLSLDSTNFDCSEVGVNTVTLYVTDANNNVDSAAAIVTVMDTLLPTVITQNASIYLDANGLASITTANIDNGSNDNCGSVTLSLDSTDFDCSEVGANNVTLYVMDANNNLDSAIATVMVMDTLKPMILACPSNLNVFTDAGSCTAVVNWLAPTSTDNCGVDSLISNYSPGDSFGIGTTEVIYIAYDESLNTDTCRFTITVVDQEKPVIAGIPSNIIIDNDSSICGAVVQWIAPTATDNCTLDSLRSNYSPGDVFPVGTSTVTYVAYDSDFNTDTASFTITVNDTEKPIIICPSNIAQCDSIVDFLDAISTDNCGIANMVRTDATGLNSGDQFPIGVSTLSYLATDIYNNQATCSFDVEVFTPPTANAGPNLATRDIEPVKIQASVTHAAQISWMPFMSLSDATIEQPLANPKTTTKYTLTVTSPEGCTVSDEMEIVVDVVQKLEATTLFSPNGDGRNDTWTVNKPELVSACKLVIFNRNGTEVYSTNNYNNDWDGTIRGENLPEGTYYYVFDCPDGRSFNGPITILRERR